MTDARHDLFTALANAEETINAYGHIVTELQPLRRTAIDGTPLAAIVAAEIFRYEAFIIDLQAQAKELRHQLTAAGYTLEEWDAWYAGLVALRRAANTP